MPSPTYRKITSADIRIARDLRREMILELNDTDPDVTHPDWRQRYLDFYASRLAKDEAALFLAEIEGQPVGVAAVYLLSNHRSEIFGHQSAYISNVWVAPQQRRQGIASELTRMAAAWAKEKGCEVVRLRSSTMGRPVYASLGFGTTDEMEMRFA